VRLPGYLLVKAMRFLHGDDMGKRRFVVVVIEEDGAREKS
jgi:hypothetical protein